MTRRSNSQTPMKEQVASQHSNEKQDELERLAAQNSIESLSKEEQEEYQEMLANIQRKSWSIIPRPVRYAGYILAVVTLLALGTMIVVLMQEIPYATWIYGPKKVVAGERASYRLAMYEPETSDFLKKIQTQIWLEGPQKKKKLFDGKSEHHVLIANLKIPDWPAGKSYKLHVLMKGPKGEERVSQAIEILPKGNYPPSYLAKEGKRYWDLTKPNSPYRMRIFSEGKTLVSALPNWVFVRVEERFPRNFMIKKPTTQPTSIGAFRKVPQSGHKKSKRLIQFEPSKIKKIKPAYKWRVPKGSLKLFVQEGRQAPKVFFTPKWGVFRFQFIGQFSSVPWSFVIQGEQGIHRFTKRVNIEGNQLVSHPEKVLLAHGEKLNIKIDSLERKADLHFDILQRGRLRWSSRGKLLAGKASASLSLPKELKGFCTLQVYSEFYDPGSVYDTHLLYIGDVDKKELLSQLRTHLHRRGHGLRILELARLKRQNVSKQELAKWSESVFALLKARFVKPNLFFDSKPIRNKKLRSYQHRYRVGTTIFLCGLGFLVLLFLFVWVYRTHQKNIMIGKKAAEEGIGEIQPQGFLFFLASLLLLACLFGGVIYLFWSMKWTFDGL